MEFSMVSCAWHYKCSGITIHLLNLMTSSNCFKWCYFTVMTSRLTSTRVLSITRNSYCNKPWWKCLHTCDKWPKLSYYKSACSNTGFYNSVKQPATASRWITWYTVEQWSCWRWWCLRPWVHLSTSLWSCPLKVSKMVHVIDWMLMCVYYNHISMSELHMLELKLIIYSGLLYSHLYFLLLQCSCIFLLNTVCSIKMQEKLVCTTYCMFNHCFKSSFSPGSPG